MHTLIKAFIDLCLFRIGPQHLPTSALLRNLVLAAFLATGLLLSRAAQQSWPQAIATTLLDTVILFSLTLLALRLLEKRERAMQTLTALMGGNVVLGLLSLPLVLFYYSGGQAENAVVSLLVLLLTIWNIMVMGHILRHALDMPLFGGIIAATLYMILSIQVLGWAMKATG